jgi:phosphoribosylformylglycinamidine (FGAM) synthase-like enzyme
MFARIEVALKPEYPDSIVAPLLRRMEMTDPHLRKLVRWARSMTVCWLDVPLSREELIYASQETLWDPVLHWLFTGNLIPSAAGKRGNVEDLLETAPNRPGKFFALEKRFRLGVTDHAARTLVQSFEAVLKRPIGADARVATGSMLLLEGPQLTEAHLARIAREYFSNELLESWTLQSEKEISHTERFHPERVKREMPKAAPARFHAPIEHLSVANLSNPEVAAFCKRKGFTFADGEIEAIRAGFDRDVTDAELELISKVWRSVPFRRLMRAEIQPDANARVVDEAFGAPLPEKIMGLIEGTFKESIREVPRAWIVSAFENGSSLLQYDEEDLLSVETEIESRTVASDATYGSVMGYAEVYLRAICAGRGAKPILATDVIFSADLHSPTPQDQDHLHPRRVLDGVKQGISKAGTQLGVPTIGGALYLDAKEGATPVVHFSAVSLLPRVAGGIPSEAREVSEGDHLVLLGARTGKEGMLGTPNVQICDTTLLHSLAALVAEVRDLGWNRLFLPCAEGGIASVVSKIAREFGGVEINLDRVPTKLAGLRPMEILGAETTERIVAIVPEERVEAVIGLAKRRGMIGADIGTVHASGRVQVRAPSVSGEELVVDIETKFLRGSQPRAVETATRPPVTPKAGAPRAIEWGDPAKEGVETLLRILSHPNVCSREWLIRQIDHEVQGTSALKPLHVASFSPEVSHSGPNDGGALKLKAQSNMGLIMTTGLAPRAAATDPYLMGSLAVDEAVRNALACGADYGKEDFLFALTYQFSCPGKDLEDPALRGGLVRACFGATRAAIELQTPFVHGSQQTIIGQASKLHFVVQAISRSAKVAGIRSADFKTPGDAVYLVGPARFALVGSLVAEVYGAIPPDSSAPVPEWDTARRLYAWLGGAIGKEQKKLRSIHDVSDGGLMTAIAEACIARGMGVALQYPEGLPRTAEWEFLFGEGFHGFIVSVGEIDAALVEAEFAQNEIPFVRLGAVTGSGVVQVRRGESPALVIETKVLRQAWKREGYWE